MRRAPLGPVSRLTLAVCLGRRLLPVAIITCYCDESFVDEFFVVAGYLGWNSVWDRDFHPAWKGVIDFAKPQPITQFAAADCRHASGEFKGWDKKTDCVRLVSDLVSVIERHDMVGFASVVILPGALDPNQKRLREKRHVVEKGSYAVAVGRMLWLVARHWPDFPEIESVSVVLDRKQGFYSRVEEQYEKVKAEIRSPADAAKFELPIPGDSEKLSPIQAADLLAYEVYKECANRIQGRKVSKALARLAAAHPIFTSVMTFPGWVEAKTKAERRALMGKVHSLWEPRGPVRSPDSWPYNEWGFPDLLEKLRAKLAERPVDD